MRCMLQTSTKKLAPNRQAIVIFTDGEVLLNALQKGLIYVNRLRETNAAIVFYCFLYVNVLG